MNTKTRKTVCTVLSALGLCAAAYLLWDSLKAYSHTVPILIGPYKQAAFSLLLAFSALSLGFCFRPLNKRTFAGTLGILFSVIWFTAPMLLQDRIPAGNFLNYWMPLPLAAFGAGLSLWLGELFPGIRTFSGGKGLQLILVLLLMFITVQPGLDGGFNWDDAFISVEAQSLRLTGESVFSKVRQEILDYLRIGRINPFATFHYPLFYFVPSVRVYKIILAALTLLSGFLFYRFLKLWNEKHAAAITGLLFVPLCFQFRIYHDPLNSYYGLMQVMFCELMGAMICFLQWQRSGKRRHLFLSLLFFIIGLMSYEMFFPLTALFLVPALQKEKNLWKAIRKILPFIFAALLIFVLSMVLRTNITEETAYNGTSFSLDIPLILRTFFNQVSAAFPLRSRTAGYDAGLFGRGIPWNSIYNTSLTAFVKNIQWQDLLGCLIIAAVLLSASDRKLVFSVYGLLFGVLLWLLPGIVISLSEKYQADLYPGQAYIPVYFSCFGMAMILYELAALAGRRCQARTIRLLLIGVSCAVLLINGQDSRRINSILNDAFLYPRQTGEAALQAGILGETGDMTVISKNSYYTWENGWMKESYQDKFYSLNARTSVHAVSAADYTAQFLGSDPALYINPGNTQIISYSGNKRGGFAKCGRLRGTGFDFENNTLAYEMVSDVFLFVSGENREGVRVLYLTRDNEWIRLPIEEAWLINETENGALYKLQQNGSVRFDSIALIK